MVFQFTTTLDIP